MHENDGLRHREMSSPAPLPFMDLMEQSRAVIKHRSVPARRYSAGAREGLCGIAV